MTRSSGSSTDYLTLGSKVLAAAPKRQEIAGQ